MSERLKFGPDYIIPKPFDPRVLVWEATAVAKAAMDTGVAQNPVDLAEYREQLEKRLGKAHELMRIMIHKAQANPKRVVFPEGTHEKILRACHVLIEEKIAIPVLLGRANEIQTHGSGVGTVPRRRHHRRTRDRSTARRNTSTSCIACGSVVASPWAPPTN